MKIITSVSGMQETVKSFQQAGLQTGLVPTMGALHPGHASLIDRAVKENQVTMASIFVNPTQFNDPDDLVKYPRTPEADLALLEKHRCSCVFMPSVKEIYGDGRELLDIELGAMAEVMEGKYRTGHFRGMVTIVYKLLKLIQPARAYFGEKDFQQLAIIRFMVQKMRLDVTVTGCETVREADGLAMSSRNIHLTPQERAAAPVIYSAMKNHTAEAAFSSLEEVCSRIIAEVEKTGLFRVEYCQIVDAETLLEVANRIPGRALRACIAVRTSKTRLIDNIAVPFDGGG